MKKFYIKPEIDVEYLSSEDIMDASDTFIDMGAFWGSVTPTIEE